MSVWLGSNLHVIVSSSELAKEVLKENDQQLADRNMSRSSARFTRDGNDLVWANYGPHYVKVRKVCTIELFTPKRLEALRPIREDEVTSMFNPFSETSPFLVSIRFAPLCHFLQLPTYSRHLLKINFYLQSKKKFIIIIIFNFCFLLFVFSPAFSGNFLR